LLKEFLLLLKVDEETADRDACTMETTILSAETLSRIADFVKTRRRKRFSPSVCTSRPERSFGSNQVLLAA
jgi:Mn-dependent DtxR family transcriptional regulator